MGRSYEKSKQAFKEAQQLMPGGVNSPVRAFKSVNTDPIFMERGKGAKIYDIDGNEYIDYVLSWGPLILGHTNDRVVESIQRVAEHGTSFGASTLVENELAKLVSERVPSIEVIRMVSSGTEATMSALRLARGFTGRNKIVKFEGCYHTTVILCSLKLVRVWQRLDFRIALVSLKVQQAIRSPFHTMI